MVGLTGRGVAISEGAIQDQRVDARFDTRFMSATTTLQIASCRSCGAPQTLTLATAARPCDHCGDPSPLPTDIRARLDRLRASLASRDETTRQLTASSLVEGDSLHGVGLITIVICWALFGGLALYLSFDHDVPLVRFLTGGEPATQWWLLWSFVLGVALSLGLLETAVARVRGLAVEALPAPPLVVGAPPRCRGCGAELQAAGALRRCSYCRTDNLVITGRYLKAHKSAERAIDDMARAFDRNLRSRIEAGDRVAMAGGVIPFFLLFVGPAVGLALPGQARLWIVPGVAIGLAVVAALVARLRRLPIEPLELLTLGQKVYVREHSNPNRKVCAQLVGPIGTVSILGHSLDDAQLAVATSRRHGDLQVVVYQVTRPQHDLAHGEREQLVAAEIWEPSPDGPPSIQQVWLLITSSGWRTLLGDAPTPHLSGHVSGKPPVIVLV